MAALFFSMTCSSRREVFMGTAEEIGQTARQAMQSWSGTVRLILLLLVAAAVFVAIRYLPLTMW
jgi:hypothetical protein